MVKDSFWTDMREIKELQVALKRVGDLPQKTVTGAVRKGANIVKAAARANAPVDTGTLKKAITVSPERNKKKGVKWFQVSFSKKYTDVLAKTSATTGKRAFYPNAQEFGFFAGHRPVTGKHYMLDAGNRSEDRYNSIVRTELLRRLDEEWKKK